MEHSHHPHFLISHLIPPPPPLINNMLGINRCFRNKSLYLEKREKTLFSHFLGDVVQKAQKKRCFSHFLRTLYKVSRKTTILTTFFRVLVHQWCATSSSHGIINFAMGLSHVSCLTHYTRKLCKQYFHFSFFFFCYISHTCNNN